MSKPNELAIKLFLLQVKQLVSKKQAEFVERKDYNYLQELLYLEIDDLDTAWKHIIELRLNHYEEGPKPDHRNDGTDVWVFAKEVNGKKAYIKLKIDERGCVCISFHRYDRQQQNT